MNLNLFNNLNKIKRKNEEAHVLLNELKEKIDMENNNLGILEDFQAKIKLQ